MNLELVTKENVDDIFSKYTSSKRSNNQKIEKFEILMKKLKFNDQDYDDTIEFLSKLESAKPHKITSFFENEINEDDDIYFCIFTVPSKHDLGDFNFTVSFISQKDFDLLCDEYYFEEIPNCKWPRFYKKEHIKGNKNDTITNS